jgi:hypothetical protein
MTFLFDMEKTLFRFRPTQPACCGIPWRDRLQSGSGEGVYEPAIDLGAMGPVCCDHRHCRICGPDSRCVVANRARKTCARSLREVVRGVYGRSQDRERSRAARHAQRQGTPKRGISAWTFSLWTRNSRRSRKATSPDCLPRDRRHQCGHQDRRTLQADDPQVRAIPAHATKDAFASVRGPHFSTRIAVGELEVAAEGASGGGEVAGRG